MDDSVRKQLVPGAKVSVIQQIPMRNRVWSSNVTGTVVDFEQQQGPAPGTPMRVMTNSGSTASSFARMIAKSPTLNLDEYTRIEMK